MVSYKVKPELERGTNQPRAGMTADADNWFAAVQAAAKLMHHYGCNSALIEEIVDEDIPPVWRMTIEEVDI